MPQSRMSQRDRIQTVRQNQVLEFIMMGEPGENAGLHLSLQVDFVQFDHLLMGCCFLGSGTHLPDIVHLVRRQSDDWSDDGKGRILVKLGRDVALKFGGKFYPLFTILHADFRPAEGAQFRFYFLPAGVAGSNGEIVYGEDLK